MRGAPARGEAVGSTRGARPAPRLRSGARSLLVGARWRVGAMDLFADLPATRDGLGVGTTTLVVPAALAAAAARKAAGQPPLPRLPASMKPRAVSRTSPTGGPAPPPSAGRGPPPMALDATPRSVRMASFATQGAPGGGAAAAAPAAAAAGAPPRVAPGTGGGGGGGGGGGWSAVGGGSGGAGDTVAAASAAAVASAAASAVSAGAAGAGDRFDAVADPYAARRAGICIRVLWGRINWQLRMRMGRECARAGADRAGRAAGGAGRVRARARYAYVFPVWARPFECVARMCHVTVTCRYQNLIFVWGVDFVSSVPRV